MALACREGFEKRLVECVSSFKAIGYGDVSVPDAELTVRRVKTVAEMRRELSGKHRNEARPRPLCNIDTLSATIVVEDSNRIQEVMEAVASQVGPWMHVRNEYAEDFDASARSGYREIVGTAKYSSGVTCKELFGRKQWRVWDELAATLPCPVDRDYAHFAVDALRSQTETYDLVGIAVEVRIVARDYVIEGSQKMGPLLEIAEAESPYEIMRKKSFTKRTLGEKSKTDVCAALAEKLRINKAAASQLDSAEGGGKVPWNQAGCHATSVLNECRAGRMTRIRNLEEERGKNYRYENWVEPTFKRTAKEVAEQGF